MEISGYRFKEEGTRVEEGGEGRGGGTEEENRCQRRLRAVYMKPCSINSLCHSAAKRPSGRPPVKASPLLPRTIPDPVIARLRGGLQVSTHIRLPC